MPPEIKNTLVFIGVLAVLWAFYELHVSDSFKKPKRRRSAKSSPQTKSTRKSANTEKQL